MNSDNDMIALVLVLALVLCVVVFIPKHANANEDGFTGAAQLLCTQDSVLNALAVSRYTHERYQRLTKESHEWKDGFWVTATQEHRRKTELLDAERNALIARRNHEHLLLDCALLELAWGTRK